MDRPLSLSSLPGTGVTGRTHLVEEGLEDTVPHSAGELLYLDTDSRELSAGVENVRLSGTIDLVVTNLYLAYAQVAPRRMRPHIRRLARLAKG